VDFERRLRPGLLVGDHAAEPIVRRKSQALLRGGGLSHCSLTSRSPRALQIKPGQREGKPFDARKITGGGPQKTLEGILQG